MSEQNEQGAGKGGEENDLPVGGELPPPHIQEESLPVEGASAAALENAALNLDDDDLDVSSGQEEELEIVGKDLNNPNVTQKESCVKDHKGPPPTTIIVMPAATRQDLHELIDGLPDPDKLSGQTQEWAMIVGAGLAHMLRGSALEGALSRENSSWQQSLTVDGREVGLAMPRAGKVEKGTILGTNDAVQHMARTLGMYGKIQVPLYHSGIWVDVDVPEPGDLLMLEQKIAEATYSLGYLTKGLIYSNTMVKMNIELVNFFLERVAAASVKDISPEALKRQIRVTDLQLMAHALAVGAYPAGFPYGRACVHDAAKCTHVVRETLRLGKLIWVDEKAFSPWQGKLMANRGVRRLTDEDLVRYQEEFIRIGEVKRNIAGKFDVVLRVPTLYDYEEAGYEWIDGIVAQAKAQLVDMSSSELDRYINKQYLLSAMQQYSHWVKEIHWPDGAVAEGREAISNALRRASADEEVTTAFTKTVQEYIDDSTAVVVAIPKYDCPKCGMPAGQDTKNHPFLIPLDAVATFFTLRDQKTRTILNANMVH